MSKDTKPHKGVSKSNVTASATAAARQQASSSSAERRLDAAPSVVPISAPTVSARYIDSRLKQFCLR